MSPENPLFSLSCADVLTKFEKRKSAGAFSGLILTTLIPTAVQSAIDIAVSAGGASVQELIVAVKPEIRAYVSNTAIKFLETALANLADVAPAK